MTAVWAVVVAGGSGDRFGEPKQFAELAGRPVVDWSIEAAGAVTGGVVVVLPANRMTQAHGADLVVAGGATRSDSVRAGLEALPAGVETVLIHDAARPLAGPDLFRAVLDALDDEGVDGAICAVPVVDTLKRVEAGKVVTTIDRNTLVCVQTPQGFRIEVLRRAHASNAVGTDDSVLVEALGATVRVVPGDPRNIKLTTPADLSHAEHLLASRR